MKGLFQCPPWARGFCPFRACGAYMRNLSHIIILKVTIMAKQLVKFMNERLQREMDKLWESGEMSNEKLQEMQSEHLRTAYK